MAAGVGTARGQSEPFGVTRFHTTDGLPSEVVTSLLFDSRGFLWVGTSEGLARFDGMAFTTWRADPADSLSLPQAWVTHIAEDRSGHLWISLLNGGLCRMDPYEEALSCFPLTMAGDDKTGPALSVFQTVQDRSLDHVIWAATARGLVRLDLADSTAVHLGPVDPDAPGATCDAASGGCVWTRCLYQDAGGIVWFGGRGIGVGRYDPGSGALDYLPHVTGPSREAEAWVVSLAELPSHPGTLWVGIIWGGMRLLDMETGEVRDLSMPEGVPDSIGEFATVQDRSGRIWVAADRGLMRWSNVLRRLEMIPGLLRQPWYAFRALTEDPSGQLWLGSFGDGLVRFAPDRHGLVRFAAHGYDVRSFADAGATLRLLGVSEGVVGVRPDDTEALWISLPGRIPDGLLVDADGDVWVLISGDGILRVHLDTAILRAAAGTDAATRIRTAPVDLDACPRPRNPADPVTFHRHDLTLSDGRVVGSMLHFMHADWSPLFAPGTRWPQSEWNRRRHLNYVPLRSLRRDATDGDVLWLAHQRGLDRIDRTADRFTRIARWDWSGGLSGVFDVAGSHSDRLWVATEAGLFELDSAGTALVRYRATLEGERTPPSVGVRHLAVSPRQPAHLWLGTNAGVGVLDTESGRVRFVSSDVHPGLGLTVDALSVDSRGRVWAAHRTSQGSTGLDLVRYDPESDGVLQMHLDDGLEPVYTDSRDRVFVAALDGYIEVQAEALRPDDRTPDVVILGVETGPRPIPGRGPSSPRGLWRGDEIRLLPGQRDLGVAYAGLQYRDPERTRYAYRLDGYDRDWVYAGPGRTARYTNLDPGAYTFRVRAANAGGVWSDPPLEVPVIVMPPWWRTPEAVAVFSVLLLSVLAVAIRVRHDRVIRRERHRAELRESRLRSEVAEEKALQAAEHAARLEALDEARSRFLANISHEFRTPLTLISGLSHDALQGRWGPLREPARQALGTMASNAGRMDRLVRQLLDLARLESGTLSLDPAVADLAQTVRGVVIAHAPLAERRGVSLVQNGTDRVVRIRHDRGKLQTAVGNLVANAIKFTRPGGTVAVSLQSPGAEPDDALLIEVSDSGVGIHPEDLGRIFDCFEQGRVPDGTDGDGLGIGLSLAREIVELHGGSIGVASDPGVGSTFRIRLPGSPPYGDQADAPAPSAEPSPVTAAVDGESTEPGVAGPASATFERSDSLPVALVVDDNADVCAFLRDHLRDDFHVLEAHDGIEALDMAGAAKPDLLIADIRMPRMDGIALCRAVRSDPGLRHMPVILLTAMAGEQNTLHGLQAGADEYVTKPFSAEVLRQMACNLVHTRERLREDFGRRVVFDTSGVHVASLDESLLERVLTVTQRHLGDTRFTLDALASEVGLSLRQLERRLPEICGETPSDLVRHMRLDHASQLLRAKAGTIQEIAAAAGYRSSSHFATAFRRRFGTTPSAYRDMSPPV